MVSLTYERDNMIMLGMMIFLSLEYLTDGVKTRQSESSLFCLVERKDKDMEFSPGDLSTFITWTVRSGSVIVPVVLHVTRLNEKLSVLFFPSEVGQCNGEGMGSLYPGN